MRKFSKLSAALLALIMSVTIIVPVSASEHRTPNGLPCNNSYYTLSHISRVGTETGIHNYTCTVTYYAYRHAKYCSTCSTGLGEGPGYVCTESHTCGNYYKHCVGVFKG